MRIFAAVGLLLMSASLLVAQLSTSSILGTVRDASGAVVPGARVTITNTSTNVARETVTSNDGSYRADALAPGSYNITISKEGFGTESLNGLDLQVAQELQANAALKVGATTQTVEIEADEAPQVNVTTSSLGGLVNSQQIADLPLNGRNFIDLALLQPGVANAAYNSSQTIIKGATYFSTNGAPIRSNLTTLDGAPEINLIGSTSSAVGTTLGVDGIQEFRVISNSPGAQYGITMGSQIVISSKGGTNQFHGDAFDYLRNNDFDAWGYFATAEPKLIRNNFGGSFGGPIKKDRTFFYATYEGIQQIQGVTSTSNTLTTNCSVYGTGGTGLTQSSNPCSTAAFTYHGTNYNCASGCATTSGAVNPAMAPFLSLYPLPNVGTNIYSHNNNQPESVNYGQIRVDQTFSSRDSMFGRFTMDASSLSQRVSNVGTPYQNVGTATDGTDQFDTLAETHIFSPTTVNTSRISYSRTRTRTLPVFPAFFSTPPYQGVYNQAFGGVAISSGLAGLGASTIAPNVIQQNIYTVSDDANWNKGKHAIQFGVLANRIEYYAIDSQYLRGSGTFTTIANFLAGNYSIYNDMVPGSDYTREPRFYTVGFYAQDDWHATQRLTLNLGLRYEFDTTLIDRHGANWAFHSLTDPAPLAGPQQRNPSFRNFEPRAGFAWDVKGDGKTSVRASFGVYDDVNASGQTFYGPSTGTPPVSVQVALQNQTIQSFPVITSAYNLTPGTMPYGASIKTSQFNVSQPRILQYNLSLQRQITPTMSITVAYAGSRGTNLWDNEEGNPCLPSSISNGIPSWTSPFVQAPLHMTASDQPAGQLANPLFGEPGQTKYISTVCKNVLNPGTPSAQLQGANYPSNATYKNPNGAGPDYVVPTTRNLLWGDWVLATTSAFSNYNAAEFSLNKRISHGLEATLAYTFSKALDEAQGQNAQTECNASGALPEQVLQPARRIYDYGRTCFDLPNVVQASVIYHFPNTSWGGFVGKEILSGWWMGNKTAWQSGYPFSPVNNTWRSLDQNVNSSGGAQSEYVNYGTTTVAPGQTGVDGTVNTTTSTFIPYNKNTVIVNQKHAGYVQWFNPLMFTMNPIGQLGTVHKAALSGPTFANVDLSLAKDTALPHFGEKGQLQFRAEVFNLFNHTNLALPSGYKTFTGTLTDIGEYSEAPVSTAGQITSQVGNQRQIQLSLKVLF